MSRLIYQRRLHIFIIQRGEFDGGVLGNIFECTVQTSRSCLGFHAVSLTFIYIRSLLVQQRPRNPSIPCRGARRQTEAHVVINE